MPKQKSASEIESIQNLRIALAAAEKDASLHKERHASLLKWLRENAPEVFQRALVELAFTSARTREAGP